MALSKPRPILQDMPFHIKKRIANKLESFFDKMTLRKVSPDFRHAIGDPENEFMYLEMTYVNEKDPKIRIKADGSSGMHFFEYTQSEEEGKCKIKTRKLVNLMGRVQQLEITVNGNFIDLVAEKLANLLDNPKFELRQLALGDHVWGFVDNQYPDSEATKLNQNLFLTRIAEVLKNLNRKLELEVFIIDCFGEQDNVLKILPYIDADHLRNFTLIRTPKLIDGFDKLIETEHWKKAKHLSMFDLPEGKLPVEVWWDHADIYMTLRFIEAKEVARVIQHFRMSPNFKDCEFSTEFYNGELEEAFGSSQVWHYTAEGQYTEFPATETMKRLFVLQEGGWVTIGRSMWIDGQHHGDDD